jgi:hypothetical protein
MLRRTPELLFDEDVKPAAFRLLSVLTCFSSRPRITADVVHALEEVQLGAGEGEDV